MTFISGQLKLSRDLTQPSALSVIEKNKCSNEYYYIYVSIVGRAYFTKIGAGTKK